MTDRLRDVLGSYADEFAEAADESDDRARSDACEVLVALARGEEPPRDVAERIVERAGAE